MTSIKPARDAAPAQWLFRGDPDWWDLVRFGPQGFDTYVRVAFPDDVDHDLVREVLAFLSQSSPSASAGFAAVWEGWGGNPWQPGAPRVPIPNREMLLFEGRTDELRDAPAIGWGEDPDRHGVSAHLVWPADESWCLACEVDEEIEFTVGCSEAVATSLDEAFPGRTRRADYGARLPLYADGCG